MALVEVGWSPGEPFESAVDPWGDDSVADAELPPAKVDDSHFTRSLVRLLPCFHFFIIIIFTFDCSHPRPPAKQSKKLRLERNLEFEGAAPANTPAVAGSRRSRGSVLGDGGKRERLFLLGGESEGPRLRWGEAARGTHVYTLLPDETRTHHGEVLSDRLIYYEGMIADWLGASADGKRGPELKIRCLVDKAMVTVIPEDLEQSVFLAARHPGIRGRQLIDFRLPSEFQVDFPPDTTWTPVLETKGTRCRVSGRAYTPLSPRYVKSIASAIEGAGYRLLNLGIQVLKTNLDPIGEFGLPPAEEDQAAHVDAAGFAHVKGIPTDVKSAIEQHALVLIAPLITKGESTRDYLIGTTAQVAHRGMVVDGVWAVGGWWVLAGGLPVANPHH